jgi:hypothetical protein
MRLRIRYILVALVLWTNWRGSVAHGQAQATSAKVPPVVVDLRTIGWVPPPHESNRAFFKDFSIGKLISLDENTRVEFLTEDVTVVYHTKQEGSDWRTAARLMEAFFIRAKDGSLLSTMRWPTRLRRSDNDLRESEARLIPLYDGRFLAFANGAMTLYTASLNPLKQQKLEPFGSSDMWAAQAVSEGHGIFLRHESTPPPRVTYWWLDSENLEVRSTTPGYRDRDFLVQAGVTAGEKSVFTLFPSGIRMIDRDHQIKTICDAQLCRDADGLRVLSSQYIAVKADSGIGVVDTHQGLAWSKSVQSRYAPRTFQFGSIRSAMSGTRFAVWVTGGRNKFFDGVKIGAWPPALLVYDVASPKDPLVVPSRPVDGQLDFALSPSGTRLAVFDGARVLIYQLD